MPLNLSYFSRSPLLMYVCHTSGLEEDAITFPLLPIPSDALNASHSTLFRSPKNNTHGLNDQVKAPNSTILYDTAVVRNLPTVTESVECTS